VARIKNVRN